MCRSISGKNTIICLLLILIVSAYSITNFLPLESIFTSDPIISDDYAQHFSQCLLVKNLLLSYGKTWGYDPFFLAGYPCCTLLDVDNKACELFVFVFSFLSEGFAFKLFLMIFLLCYPFLLYLAARNFDLSRTEAVTASVLSILFFYLSSTVDTVAWGMFSFAFLSFLSIYFVSVFYKWFNNPDLRCYAVLLFLSATVFLIHIISPVLLFVPVITMYILSFRRMKIKHHAMLWALAALILMINSYWLIPMARFYPQITSYEYMGIYTPFQIYYKWAFLDVYLKQKMIFPFRPAPELNNPFIEVMLLLFATAGFYAWVKEKKIKLLVPLLLGTIFFFVIGYYGSHTDFFRKLHPQRFLIPLNIFLIVPASKGLCLFSKKMLHGQNFVFKIFLFCLFGALLVRPVVKPLYRIFKHKPYMLKCAVPQPLEKLLEWIRNNTNKEARILLEDSEFDSGHQYYGTHLPALFPVYTQREYICGPRPYPAAIQGIASFTSGILFNKNVEELSLKELKDYSDLYNIKWVICWSEESIELFDKFPGYFIRKEIIGKFNIYELRRKTSFFLKGEGIINSDYNRLELSQVKAEDGEIIVKYHWMDYLVTEPPLKIEKVIFLDDKTGFIRVLNPPAEFRIVNGY